MRALLIHDQPDFIIRLSDALQAVACVPQHEDTAERAADRLKREAYDVIFIVPSLALELAKQVNALRRASKNYVYVVMVANDLSLSDVVESGANDFMGTDFDDALIVEKMDQVRRLLDRVGAIGNEKQDFPSAGGIIGRSAFNQLFFSALTRAGRYAEQTSVLFITLDNYDELYAMGGPYTADYLVAGVAKTMADLRRQSDIAGQVSKNMFALLLQRPTYETEPLEAAARFESVFKDFQPSAGGPEMPARVRITLLELPSGRQPFSRIVNIPDEER